MTRAVISRCTGIGIKLDVNRGSVLWSFYVQPQRIGGGNGEQNTVGVQKKIVAHTAVCWSIVVCSRRAEHSLTH